MNTVLEEALGYAARGWPVLPLHTAVCGRCTCGNPQCPSPGKHPRTAHGVKDASCSGGTIRRWWRMWPDANIGLATGEASGIAVLDLDPGSDGWPGPKRELPTGCVVETPRGGRHHYFGSSGSSVGECNVLPVRHLRTERCLPFASTPPAVPFAARLLAATGSCAKHSGQLVSRPARRPNTLTHTRSGRATILTLSGRICACRVPEARSRAFALGQAEG
jgi:hypothetical protein